MPKAMDKRDPKLRQAMAEIALALPGVFEATQWGGWVYKVVGRDGTKKTSSKTGGAKMLCYVVDGKNLGWHCQFKLPGTSENGRAHDVQKTAWVEVHPWKTLGPSGWVVARPRTPAQLKQLAALLAESRAILPSYEDPGEASKTDIEHPAKANQTKASRAPSAASSNVARRLDAVMREARELGWAHADPDAEAFDG